MKTGLFHRNSIRKITAFLLAAVMMLPQNITAFADIAEMIPEAMPEDIVFAGAKAQSGSYGEEGFGEVFLPGEHIASASDAAGDGSVVYFGSVEVSASEPGGILNIPVYREGRVSEAASVTVRTLDMMAIYGEDYRVLGENKTEYPGGISLMERAMTAETGDGEAPGLLTYGVDLESGEAERIASPSDASLLTAGAEDDAGMTAKVVIDQTGKSRLALEKEAETGIPARETVETAAQSVSDAILSSIMPDILGDIVYSCEQVLYFAPGSNETTLRVEILDDDISEGMEMFTVIMVTADGSEIYSANNSMSVVINDDEEGESSLLSFSSDTYEGTGGVTTVRILREGAEHSIATAVLYGLNEATGIRKALGQVVFVPYQTELEQKIALEGLTALELDDLEGAAEGTVVHAELVDFSADGAELLSDSLLGSDDILGLDPDGGTGSLSREVTIDGRKYTLRYNKNESVATIVDKAYSPELEVGRYFFCAPPQKGGMFRFWKSGDNPGWTGSWKSEYRVKNQSDAAQNYGYMHYYSGYLPDKGVCGTYVSYKESQIEEPYYQVIFPEWEQTSNKYWGHRSWFELREDTDEWGAFSSVLREGKIDRCFDTGAGARIINANGYNGSGKVALRAFVQDNSNHTPVLDMYFYGVAAMYRRYRISAVNPEPLKLKTGARDSAGNYITTEMEPAIASIKCGAQVIAGSQGDRDMLLNVDPDKSSTVVTLGTNTLYGKSHIYGKITGYQITIAPGAQGTTLKYPEDYLKYLEEGRSKTKKGTALSFAPEEIAAIKKKVLNNLQTIPFDKYFADWIQSNQKQVYGTSELSSKAYYQKLQLKPIFSTSDVKVEVVRPEGGLDAVFADQHLKTSAPGTSYTYHAGDRLDLTPAGYDTGAYEADGYDISVDGGLWRNIPDENYLLLEPGRSYRIRPSIRAKKNWIEVRPEAAAATGLTVVNTVPQEVLKDYSDLSGKLILDLHPEKSNIYDRIRPEPGRYYEIVAKAEDDRNGGKQGIAFTDPETGEKYQSNIFYLKAERSPANNIVRVTRYAVREDALTEYSVSGMVVLKTNALREDAQEHRAPMEGYSVFCPDGRGAAGDLTDNDGQFELTGIRAAKGDRRQILFGTNLNQHDSQIIVVEFGDETEIRKGMIELMYPHDAPRIASLTYSYANNQTADVSLNTFPVMDDSLILKAIVDESPSGHKAKEVVFTLHRADGRVDGSAFIFKAKPEKDGSNVFSVQIDKMLDVFRNGDYFTVHLVDSKTAKVIIEGKEQEIPILYPEAWTGLTAYTENVYIEPKEMQFGIEHPEKLDLPFVGRVGGKLMSGPLGLSKTKWTKGDGYTITLNLQALVFGGGSPSTEDKLKAFDEFRVKTAQQLADKKFRAINGGTGKEISNGNELIGEYFTKENGPAKNMEDLSKRNDALTNKIAHAEDEQSEVGADQKKSKWKHSLTIVVGIELDFIHRPSAGDYFLAQWAIMAGGSHKSSRTWPFLIGSVPVFINFSGYEQANLVWGMVTDEIKEAVSAGEFNNTTGNISKLLNRDDNYLLDLDILVKPTVTAGVGLNGVLNVKGYIAPHFHFQLLENIMPNANGLGAAIGFSGGMGVDLIFTSISIDIVRVAKGWGSLKEETGVSFFNGLKAADISEDQGEFVPRERNASVLSEGTQEIISAEEYSYGTADMSDFAEYGSGMFGDLPGETLLMDAADRTRPQMIELDDGRQLLLFIGKRQTAGDEACLYYTIRDRDPEGEWTEPKPVNDDGTFDSSPALVKTEKHVVAAWTDTIDRIDGEEDFRKKANAFAISAAVFDPATGTFGQKIALTDRKNFNILPRLCAFGDKVICTFLARDVDSMTSVLDLADLSSSYNAPKYTVFDAALETVDISEKTGSREHFIRAVSEEQEDPMVTDLTVETVKIGEKQYAVLAYTVDGDCDQTSFEDRKLYLKIDNLTDRRTHFPILVNRDTIMDAAPKLTKLKGELYLTWLSEGAKFHLLKVDDVLELLDDAGVLEGGEDPEKLISKEQTEDRDWYRIMPEQIKNKEVDADEAGGICAYLADNLLPYETLDLDDKEVGKGISEYELTTDGTDLYIFFGSQTGTDPEAADKAIYAFRYMTGGVEFGTYEDPETGEGDWTYRDFGFALPSQMTDNGRVLDEFDVLMDDQKRISVVSNAYRQRINEEGKLEYSRNDLLYLNGIPERSVEIVPETASISSYLVGGEQANISFDVINNGLLPVEGYRALIRTEEDGREIWSGDFAKTLDSGQTDTILCTWTVPEDVSGSELEILVEELGGSQKEPSISVLEVPFEENIVLSTPDIRLTDGELTFRTTVSNRGNADADAFTLVLRNNSTAAIMSGEDKTSAFASREIPSLASGEEKEVELSFKIAPEHFDSWGRIQLRGSAERGEEVLGETFGSYNASVPMVAKILCASEPKIKGPQDVLTLSAQAAPWEDIAGGPVYSSSDEGIAIVDQTGRVRGVKNGTAVITVSYPKWGLMDSIEVMVTGMRKDDPEEPGHTGNTIPGGPAGARRMIGRWQQASDGSWKFLNSDGSTFTGWGYISTANGWDYYHLRTDGFMDSGWYFDEKLKKWYYLNEQHDGKFGAMTRGWHLDARDGKWYYLDPKTGEMSTGWVPVNGKWYYLSPGSTVPSWIKNEKGEWVYSGTGRAAGSMYANEKTPDGYTVDANGAWTGK